MAFLAPIAAVVALWWLATVVALYRTGLPRRTFRATFVAATVLGAAGLALIVATRELATVPGAYAAFAGALAIWSWHELSYLLGYVNGPRAAGCPAGLPAARRFWLGVKASLYHELAIVLTALALWLVSAGSANRVAFWTFTVFWLMRWSVKLNIFLGVRNLRLDYLPVHLQYLSSYVGRRDMNPWFPVAMVVAAFGIAALIASALNNGAGTFVATSQALFATLLVLAVLEHVLLMIDVSDDVLWRLATTLRSWRPGTGNAP
ncbi:MAG: putative photosynthetic complex assembly protein PuhE [Pseudomonadota bacterium]